MNPRTETIQVPQSQPSARLDTFLRGQFPAMSRGAVQRLIKEGHIRVNGQTTKSTHHPRAGEVIEIHRPEARPSVARAEALPLDILFEDEDLLVVNKPPGLVVHPAAGHEEHTLVNALLHHCAGRLSGIGGVARPGIVHRIDKETSGCLVVAKNDATHQALSQQFAERKVGKIYHAIVCGELVNDSGTISRPIMRHPTHRKRMAAMPGQGREALTNFRVLERMPAATLVEATLHTGRTHQIRVHFQHLGHPLVGDQIYGNRQNRRLMELTGYGAARQMLHARTLVFIHPRTSRKRTFAAPLPEDFKEALAVLRL